MGLSQQEVEYRAGWGSQRAAYFGAKFPKPCKPSHPCPLCLGNPFELERAHGGQRVMSSGPSTV